jgi:hypothetical protein
MENKDSIEFDSIEFLVEIIVLDETAYLVVWYRKMIP